MRAHNYSRQSAIMFLRVVISVLGGAAAGHFLHPGLGAGLGAGVGVLAVAALLFRDSLTRRRGPTWISAARTLGMKPVEPLKGPRLPFKGLTEIGHLLVGAVDGRTLYVGDRLERVLVVQRGNHVGRYSPGNACFGSLGNRDFLCHSFAKPLPAGHAQR